MYHYTFEHADFKHKLWVITRIGLLLDLILSLLSHIYFQNFIYGLIVGSLFSVIYTFINIYRIKYHIHNFYIDEYLLKIEYQIYGKEKTVEDHPSLFAFDIQQKRDGKIVMIVRYRGQVLVYQLEGHGWTEPKMYDLAALHKEITMNLD